jgi:hypothetical protein
VCGIRSWRALSFSRGPLFIYYTTLPLLFFLSPSLALFHSPSFSSSNSPTPPLCHPPTHVFLPYILNGFSHSPLLPYSPTPGLPFPTPPLSIYLFRLNIPLSQMVSLPSSTVCVLLPLSHSQTFPICSYMLCMITRRTKNKNIHCSPVMVPCGHFYIQYKPSHSSMPVKCSESA